MLKYVKIKSITKEDFRGNVYDLTVDDVHSYNIDGLAVHNSGAGSLVNYTLRITNVDPLIYNLYFERFLNKDRGHMPDIDSDFSPSRVSELYDHLNSLYGEDHCANVGTMNFMQARSVVKDIARVFGIPMAEVNACTKAIPSDVDNPEALLEIPEVKAFFDAHPGMYTHVSKLFGAPRHTGQHPAGIIVSPMPITDIIPVHNATATASGLVHGLTSYDAGTCEDLGGVKFDLLAIDGLDSLDYQMRILRERYGMSGYLDDIPLDDKGAWDVICAGDTLGIWQMESPVGKGTIAKVQPRNMDELAAVNAFIRPGASGLDSYVAGKRDASRMKRYHPLLDQYLASTYGAIVFQEQTMALIAELTGVSFGKADIVRRAVDKPKKGNAPEIIEQFRKDALRVGVEKGIPENVVTEMIKTIIDGGGYGFNAAHAVCYAFIAYYGAYMKCHYPAAFYCAMVNMSAPTKLPAIFAEAGKHGVHVTPPDVSLSKLTAVVDDVDDLLIHAGLGSIKGLGPAAIDKVVANQPYTSFNDMFARFGDSKTAVDALVDIGATEHLPLEIAVDDLGDDVDFGDVSYEEFTMDDGTTAARVQLNRDQQRLWWAEYVRLKDAKPVRNVKVPLDDVPAKYVEMYENPKKDLGVGKDGTFTCAPALLSMFGFSAPDPAWAKTNGKMKGVLADKEQRKLPRPTQALLNALDQIKAVRVDPLEDYLRDLARFGVSFAGHPYEYTVDAGMCSVVANKPEGSRVSVVGVITAVDKGKTKSTGKDRIIVSMQTPREMVRIWLWPNQVPRKTMALIAAGQPLWFRGWRAFGEYLGSPDKNHEMILSEPPTMQEAAARKCKIEQAMALPSLE